MNNIYIKTLELGFDNPEGISLDEVVERLNIDKSDVVFLTNYTIWFYANFFNNKAETKVIGNTRAINPDYRINVSNVDSFTIINTEKSYLKGDAVNKYIDFLELQRTRESSKKAAIFSTVSIVLAALAIIISLFLNPKQPYEVKIVDDKEKVVLPVIKQAEQVIISDTDSICKDSISH